MSAPSMVSIEKLRDVWEDIERCGPGPRERSPDKSIYELLRRDHFIADYAWAVPSKEAIKKIKDFVGKERVLEVGAGKGLWAKLIKDEGINIVATDDMSWTSAKRFDPAIGQFFKVIDMEAKDAVKAFPEHEVLMMVWPPYSEPMAKDALAGFSGNKLIFIGESIGGCTADEGFFEDLHDHWIENDCVALPQWDGIHDMMTLWIRKSAELSSKLKAAREEQRSAKKSITNAASDIGVKLYWPWDLHNPEILEKLSALPNIRGFWENYNKAATALGIDHLPDFDAQ